MLRRAWAAGAWAGAAPQGDRLTIDPDATRVAVFGPGKEGSAFSPTGQTALSPLASDSLPARDPLPGGHRF